MRNVKQYVCNNSIYTLEDDDLLQFPVIQSLVWVHNKGQKFVFSELDCDIIAILEIEKPIPPPFDFINVDDVSSYLVTRTTIILYF